MDGCYLFASYLVRIETDRTVLMPEFLNFHLNSSAGQIAVRTFATPGVSQSNISAGSLKRVYVPMPPLTEQMRIVRELSEIAATKRTAKGYIEVQQAAQRELINSFVS